MTEIIYSLIVAKSLLALPNAAVRSPYTLSFAVKVFTGDIAVTILVGPIVAVVNPIANQTIGQTRSFSSAPKFVSFTGVLKFRVSKLPVYLRQ